MTDLPDLSLEYSLWNNGTKIVAGMDEAGRGALAGPVTVAVVVLPAHRPLLHSTLCGVRDSKQMTPPARERAAQLICQVADSWTLGWASAEEIDTLGILAATRLAAERALAGLPSLPDHLLTDFGLLPELELSITSLVKGDRRSLSIACASVLAKTARDAYLRHLDSRYPGYGFARHKGYGTALHRRAILEHGYTPIHRKTFLFAPPAEPAPDPPLP